MRRIVVAAVACGLAAAPAVRALDATEWKFRQSLEVAAGGIVTVSLPAETLDAARADLGDVRVVDRAGQEIAFTLTRGTRGLIRPAGARSFRSTLAERATELLIACGDRTIENVMLETPALDFVKRARVETSRDGNTWMLAQDGLPLFRQAGVSRLNVPGAPFVRVTIDDTRSPPVPFTGARVFAWSTDAARTMPLPAKIARREEFAGETLLTLELDAAHAPLASLTLATPERLFTRRVNVGVRELRDESAIERTAASGTIYNVAIDGAEHAEQTTVPLDFTPPSRELLLHIANEDSPPLAIREVSVTRFEVMLTFDAPAAGEYALLIGHGQIAAPRYDITRLGVDRLARTTALSPGPLTPNPGYRKPEALAGTLALGAPLDPAPWNYRKAVRLAAGGVQQLELDLDVLVHAQRGFADLRLLRDGVQVPYLVERPAVFRSLEIPVAHADDPKRPGISRWQLKLPRAGIPLARLTLESPTALFQRQLRVLERITDDRGNAYERSLAAVGAWSHTPGETRPLVLPIDLPPATDTLIVEADNGDNPPIVLAKATATHAVTRLLFKTDIAPPALSSSQGLGLYYGNPSASTPRYDLALVSGQILGAEKSVATLAAEEKTRADGWTRTMLGNGRGGWIFWSALALVVVVLLAVVAKMLPKPPAPT